MEELVTSLAVGIALCCESAGVALVAIGAMDAALRTLRPAVLLGGAASKKETWLRFAAWIALSLEFALAADIARTAVAPSWTDIGHLAAIATIRTGLNLFLERDLKALREP
jgi:uncharacterized membrane protein